MKLSIVIPAYNEAESLPETINHLYSKLLDKKIDHEIVVINDNSNDDTVKVLQQLKLNVQTLTYYTNLEPNGFGYAVRLGLDKFTGDVVAIMMADLSDSAEDLLNYYFTLR